MPAFPKISYLIVASLCIIGACKNKATSVGQAITKDTTSVQNEPVEATHDSIFNNVFDKDSIIIRTDVDTMVLHKNQLNALDQFFPEIVKDNPQHPDIDYAISEHHPKNEADTVFELGCEVCQDEYYVIYAHFLKIRNGDAKYRSMRDNLREIYYGINAINQKLRGGGTYFGHQYSRIQAYTEYSIYLYKGNEAWYHRDYPIIAQKQLFIQYLKQLITDQVQNDPEIDKSKRDSTKIELCKIVDDINKRITDNFYLKQAQEFQFSHY